MDRTGAAGADLTSAPLLLVVRAGAAAENLTRPRDRRKPDHLVPLTDEGRRQARAAGLAVRALLRQRPAGSPPAVLWHSPLAAAIQTAETLAAAAGEAVGERLECALLAEQTFGLYDAVGEQEAMQRFPEAEAARVASEQFSTRFWAAAPPGGENQFQVCVRAWAFLAAAFPHGERAPVVAVTHSLAGRALAMAAMRKPSAWLAAERAGDPGSVRGILGRADLGYLPTPRDS
jgi:broad specificity phosphatase PhoE